MARRLNPLLIALAVFGLTLSQGASAAATKIYTYLDDQGVRHFTDVPDNARYKLLRLSPNERTESGDRYDAQLLARATQYDSIIERAAAEASVEPNLVRAVILVESGFNPHAVSKRGARGLMQLMPATASRFGITNAMDPAQNIVAGARYLHFLMNRFGRNVSLVLAAYNAGEEAVERNGGQIPPYSETLAYVPRVLKFYRMLDQPRLARQS
jgi:soluble lytic murein transglycosylase-like protein